LICGIDVIPLVVTPTLHFLGVLYTSAWLKNIISTCPCLLCLLSYCCTVVLLLNCELRLLFMLVSRVLAHHSKVVSDVHIWMCTWACAHRHTHTPTYVLLAIGILNKPS
jgi:hypothetical protein